MANENKKTNELVDDDDDPTSELEALTDRHLLEFGAVRTDDEAEADANTFDIAELSDDVTDGKSLDGLKSDLRKRSETIERCSTTSRNCTARWLGLETEIKAREELTDRPPASSTRRRKLASRDKR